MSPRPQRPNRRLSPREIAAQRARQIAQLRAAQRRSGLSPAQQAELLKAVRERNIRRWKIGARVGGVVLAGAAAGLGVRHLLRTPRVDEVVRPGITRQAPTKRYPGFTIEDLYTPLSNGKTTGGNGPESDSTSKPSERVPVKPMPPEPPANETPRQRKTRERALIEQMLGKKFNYGSPVYKPDPQNPESAYQIPLDVMEPGQLIEFRDIKHNTSWYALVAQKNNPYAWAVDQYGNAFLVNSYVGEGSSYIQNIYPPQK